MNGLILNLGLKSIRAIIFNNEGKALTHSYKVVNSYLDNDRVEQDPQEWWEKGLSCIKEALKVENKIDFITVTSSAACVIPVTKDGDNLMRTIMVSDKRAKKESDYIQNLSSFKDLPYTSGVYYTIPRILWIKNNCPDIYNLTDKFVSPNDFLIHKLTGEFCIDPLNAGKYFTVNDQYPQELLQELEINIDSLPPIQPIGTKLSLSSEMIQELGLSNEVKVILTTYDAICAFFGSGPEKEGDACDMSGTVTSLRALTHKKIKETESRIFEQKYQDWNVVGGSNNMGGGLIEWALEIFYQKNEHGKLELLKEHFSAETGLLFLPYLLGERAPLWDDHVRGTFLGIERTHNKDDLTRAVLESTGYLLRQLVECVESNDITINRLFVSGGLSRLDIINQIKADILGKEVIKVEEVESTSFGAYSIARKCLDENFNPQPCFKIEKVYMPNLEKHKIYSETYSLFQDTYQHLKEFHEKRKDHLQSRRANSNQIKRTSL